ncbi:hypothetical protein V6N11_079391 [Hibiscus sabdariffa]|uniref:Phorbol-ester/DAG-type domain-containing protein n=1 Tax=Hibiscus sabdariffa TaxID=183260 RepID=A0ABR2RVS0_9ROSI
MYISVGYRYRCSSCNFNLDVACASSLNDHLPKDQELLILKDQKKMTILHYSHGHSLSIFKYKKVRGEHYYCFWCEKRLSEVCWGCTECKFYLHSVCRDKIPRRLSHPFHPGHPLRLRYIPGYCSACGIIIGAFSPCYMCEVCDFRLDFDCAKLLPTQKLICHKHLLTYFKFLGKSPEGQDFYCEACGKPCGGFNVYRCMQCHLSFHLRCVDKVSSRKVPCSSTWSIENKALVVSEMEHNEETNAIRTLVCNYIKNILANCYSNQLRNFFVNVQIQPIFHSHQMYEVTEEFKGNKFCHGCRLVLDGPSYFCKTCHDFYLHAKCAKLPFEIQHPFHSAHPLNLYTSYRPGISRFITCDECKDISLGFIYFCELCNFKLDIKCAARITHDTGASKEKEMDKVTELHCFHQHKLVVGYCHDPINETKCTICELPIIGPAYFCSERLCNYILHESCLRLPQMIQVPFHPEHMLVFRLFHIHSNPRCYACPLNLNSFTFAYNCEHCHLSLHPVCANSLKRPLKCESYPDDLYYFGPDYQLLYANYDQSWATDFVCKECERSRQGEAFYRCIQCQINFHLNCIPIPEIVKSKYHIHPLVLKDSLVEEDSEDNMAGIRKNRPQQSLQKKPHEGLQAQPIPSALHSAIEKKLENFPAMVVGVWTDDRNLQLEASTQILQLLAERNPPIDEVIQAGVIPRFVELLTRDDFPELQLALVCALVIIASGTSENRKVLIDHGAVPVLVKLLGSPNDEIRQMAVMTLGIVAFDSHRNRDLVLSHGALLPLLALLNEQASFSLLHNASFTLLILCCVLPLPPLDQVKPALPTLARLICLDDQKIVLNACRALQTVSCGTRNKAQAVFEAGVSGRLMQLLFHPSPIVFIPALDTIANISSVDDMPTQSIFEANIIVRLVDLLQNDNDIVKSAAARAIRNAICRGTPDQIKFLVSQGCVKPLCNLLICPDPNIVNDCLVGIERILMEGDAYKTMGTTGGVNLYAQMIEEAGGREKIENLRSHDNTEVSQITVKILEAYWRE